MSLIYFKTAKSSAKSFKNKMNAKLQPRPKGFLFFFPFLKIFPSLHMILGHRPN